MSTSFLFLPQVTSLSLWLVLRGRGSSRLLGEAHIEAAGGGDHLWADAADVACRVFEENPSFNPLASFGCVSDFDHVIAKLGFVISLILPQVEEGLVRKGCGL